MDVSANGHGSHLLGSGDSTCASKLRPNSQRSTFCVSDGTNFQSIIGGINGDSYGNGHGPCMCNSNNICGECTSTAQLDANLAACERAAKEPGAKAVKKEAAAGGKAKGKQPAPAVPANVPKKKAKTGR